MSRWPQVTVALVLCACSERPVPEPIPDDVGQRWADVVCPAAMACDCETYASIEDCEAHILAEFERLEPTMRDFDEACFEQHLQSDVYATCGGGLDDGGLALPSCWAFYGNGQPGDPCERPTAYGLLSVGGTCGPETTCHPQLGICRDWDPPPAPKAAGDACSDQLYRACIDAQLYCHVDTCRPLIAVGEPCTHPDACGWDNVYCRGLAQGQGTCAPQLTLGAACDPADMRPCGPQTEALEWCNPATARCEAPEPAVCRIE